MMGFGLYGGDDPEDMDFDDWMHDDRDYEWEGDDDALTEDESDDDDDDDS